MDAGLAGVLKSSKFHGKFLQLVFLIIANTTGKTIHKHSGSNIIVKKEEKTFYNENLF